MEKANVAGINIAFVRRGHGPALVLIHGFPLDHSTWDELAPLLDLDFDLIIPDLRGFGSSDVMEADDSIIDYASDIAGLLDHLKIKRAFLAGHSMGGYIALAFVRENQERVAGLAMVASQARADSPERKAGRLATAKQVLNGGERAVIESLVPKLSADGRVQAFVRELMSRQRPLGIYTALRAMAERPDSTDLFSTFTFPVVVLHGDADALIPVEMGREMKATLAAAHYVELAGVGHMLLMEAPQALAQGLRFFTMG